MGRCFQIRGEGTSQRQSRGRYMEERPFVWCLEESCTRNTAGEGKEEGSLAAAGAVVERAQAMQRAPRGLLYLQ